MRTSLLKVLVTLFLLGETSLLFASLGDTTWVTVFSQMQLTHHGNYDTTVAFPTGKRYRKIRMHYILGRYACPPNTQYCGSWDYTTQIFALPKAKDSVEIARVITPYATDWLGKNKSHDYIVDVSDYATVLDDSTHMRFRYDGYSWGFTLTLRIEFIEGVPPMDAVGVKNIYRGYFAYGNAANPIENHLSQRSLLYTSPKAKIKNSISGHGADATGCSEFCNKYYMLHVNSQSIGPKQIWRSDCGSNEVYPQTGTWIFDRSNWCPGAVVWPIYHDLDGITTPATTFTADIDMQPYTISNPSGGYNFVSQLVSYSNMNHNVDVSLEEIIAPTYDPNYARENPACSNPVLKIKNVGLDPVLSVAFEYGMVGRIPATYTAYGVINSMEEKTVVLPPMPAVMAQSVAVDFEAKITAVNDMNDENSFNNTYMGKTKPVSVIPKDLIVRMGTNGSKVSGNLSETSWYLYNGNDSLVASRSNATINTVYADTVKNLPDGCYRFVASDAGCDGFDWWYYQYYQPNPGIGSMRIDKTNGAPQYQIPGDIGCGYTRFFYVGAFPAAPGSTNTVGMQEQDAVRLFEVYPNPASSQVLVKVETSYPSDVAYTLRDIGGRIIERKETSKVQLEYMSLDVQHLSAGMYLVELTVNGQRAGTRKLVVQER